MLWIIFFLTILIAYLGHTKDDWEENRNIIYFLSVILVITFVFYLISPSSDSNIEQDYYRYTDEEEDCYRKYQKNYPDVPADFGENALSFQMCLEEARS